MKSWFICSILSLVLLVGAYLPVAADLPPGDTCAWIGAADDNWHNPANWGCGHVPGPNDLAIVAPPVVRWPRIYPQPAAFAGSVAINGGATLALDPNAALTVSTDVTLDRSAELFPGVNSTITLRGGAWTNNGGYVPVSTAWTVVFDGLADQQVKGAAATQTFHNLTLNNNSMSLPEFGVGGGVTTLNIRGTLTVNDATIFNTGTASHLNLWGNLINNGGALRGSAVVTFGGINDQIIGGSVAAPVFSGPVVVDKPAGKLLPGSNTTGLTFNGPLNVTRGTLALNGTSLTTQGAATIGQGALDLGGGPWTAQGTVTLGPGATFTPGAGAAVVLENGDWTNNGGAVTDAAPPWGLLFNGPGDQWINGTATTQSFGNVALANHTMALPAVQVNGPTRINLHTLTLGPDTIFRPGTATTVRVNLNWVSHGGQFEGGPQHEIYFGGGYDQLIGGTATSQTFPGRVTVDKTAGAVTIGGDTRQVTVDGGVSVYGGTLGLGAATLTTRGPLDIMKNGVFRLGSGVLNAWACFTVAAGGVFDPGSGTFNFRGSSWSNYSGTVYPGTWTANFYPRPVQVLDSSAGTQQFHNIGIYNDTMGPATLNLGPKTNTLNVTGNLFIGDSATFGAGPARQISVGGDWNNDGYFAPRASTVSFGIGGGLNALGPVAGQTIGGAQPTTFNGLAIDNPDGVILGNSQLVSGTLDLKSGNLTTAGHTLTLRETATVTGTHEVIGTVQRTQAFAPGVPYSFGGADLTITFAEVGSVTGLAVDTQLAAPASLKPALPRTVTITPAGAGYVATLRLPYQEADLNGIPEADLRLWRQGDDRWETQGPQVANAAENWVEQSDITAFSTWALASVNASQGGRLYLPLVVR